jgi:DNA-directed RNA polymerase subunit RPC12/RpoP
MLGQYCGHCGEELAGSGSSHPSCVHALQLEPPRFCQHCGRRMVVQVSPTGWTAQCSRHAAVSDRERTDAGT